MIGVAIATAAAGIIVGTVSLTGIGLVMTEVVELISGGNLMIMLLLTAVICLILGMGLPTTANYIVVATLMAPVIVELAAKSDLAVPLVAAHLFVFYFGLMADVTPPVGLASFAAAAISGASSLATGVQAFRYEIRTALLPFIFVFNNQLLLIGVDSIFYAVIIIAGSIIAMLLFVAATQNWFLVKSRWWETALLFVACFVLFRPGFFMDRIDPAFTTVPASEFQSIVAAVPPGGHVRFRVVGEDLRGKPVDKTVALRLDAAGPAEERLAKAGLALRDEDGKLFIDDVRFRTEAAKIGLDLDYEIVSVERPHARPPKELFYSSVSRSPAWSHGTSEGGAARPSMVKPLRRAICRPTVLSGASRSLLCRRRQVVPSSTVLGLPEVTHHASKAINMGPARAFGLWSSQSAARCRFDNEMSIWDSVAYEGRRFENAPGPGSQRTDRRDFSPERPLARGGRSACQRRSKNASAGRSNRCIRRRRRKAALGGLPGLAIRLVVCRPAEVVGGSFAMRRLLCLSR